jgi:hypothetical protein
MQLFRITPDEEALVVRANNLVRDNLQQDGVYLIIDDNKKIVWIYKGYNADLILQFIGGKLQQEMLKSLPAVYRASDLNSFHNDSETVTEVLDAIVKAGTAQEIRKKRKEEEVSSISTKRPVYMTIAESRRMKICVHKDVHAKDVIPKVLEFDTPPGYVRHMSMIAGNVYNEDKSVKKFITESKEEASLNKLGILPNGFYFLENMSSRLYIKDGKVACLDFMVEKEKDLGENRVLVPVLHREKLHREGDVNIVLESFKASDK